MGGEQRWESFILEGWGGREGMGRERDKREKIGDGEKEKGGRGRREKRTRESLGHVTSEKRSN